MPLNKYRRRHRRDRRRDPNVDAALVTGGPAELFYVGTATPFTTLTWRFTQPVIWSGDVEAFDVEDAHPTAVRQVNATTFECDFEDPKMANQDCTVNKDTMGITGMDGTQVPLSDPPIALETV